MSSLCIKRWHQTDLAQKASQSNKGDVPTHIFYLVLSLICIISLTLIWYCFKDFGLWGDELATLDSVCPFDLSYLDWVLFSFKEWSYNFYWFAVRLVYELNPYTDMYLKLFHETMLIASVFIVGLTGKALKNNTAGLIAASIFATQYAVWFYIAQQVRYYPALCLFSALTLYFFVKGSGSKNRKWSYIIFYGLSVGLLVNTQILAAFLPIILFIVDIILILLRKKQVQHIISYVIALPFGIGFLIYTLTHPSFTVNMGWSTQISNLENLLSTPQNLIGASGDFSSGLLLLLLFGIVVVSALYSLKAVFNSNFRLFVTRKHLICAVVVLAPMLAILFSWIASSLTDDKYGNFLPRYFQYLYPWIYFSIGLSASLLIKKISNTHEISFIGVALSLSFFVFFTTQTYPKACETHSQGAEMNYVYERQEEIGSDAALLINAWDTYTEFGASLDTQTKLYKKMYLDEDWEAGKQPDIVFYLSDPKLNEFAKRELPKSVILFDYNNNAYDFYKNASLRLEDLGYKLKEKLDDPRVSFYTLDK